MEQINLKELNWITPGQAGYLVGVHRDTIIRWCKENGLPCDRTPTGRYRIYEKELRAWVEAYKAAKEVQ